MSFITPKTHGVLGALAHNWARPLGRTSIAYRANSIENSDKCAVYRMYFRNRRSTVDYGNESRGSHVELDKRYSIEWIKWINHTSIDLS